METYIKCFLVAAELGSFSDAAKKLDMPKQEISRQIVRLEEELNHPLFVRTGTQTSLNAAGVVYYSLFQRLHNQFLELQNEIKNAGSGTSEFRIGCMKLEGIGNLLSGAISSFCEENPNINLIWEDYMPAELLPLLEKNKLDMVIVYDDILSLYPNRTLFKWMAVHQASLNLLVSKNHPLAREDSRVEDFIFEPCYLFQEIGENALPLKNWLCVSPEVSLDIRNAKSPQLVKAIVDSGRGTTLCSDLFQWVDDPNLNAYPIMPAANVLCVWRKDDMRPSVIFLEKKIEQSLGLK